MILAKASPKGRLKNDSFMNTGAATSGTANAVADLTDIQVTRSFMTDAYKVNEWIRAIVDRGSERTAQVELFPIPLGAKKGVKEGQLSSKVRREMENVMNLFMKPNVDGESFHSLMLKVYRDIMIYDEAGMQITSNSSTNSNANNFELYANVSGEEIFVNAKKNGSLPNNRTYLQLKNGVQEVASWSKGEFLNFIRYRRAGYSNGFSPIASVATSIMGDLEAMNYNLKFFENNARPDFAFMFENLGFGRGDAALKRAKAWYLQEHQGKPHLPLFMGSEKGNVKLVELKVNQKEMGFFEWQMLLLNRIMAVYGMQPTILGANTSSDTIGKIDSEVQGEQFKKNTIIPLIRMATSVINSSLIWHDDNFDYDDIYITSTNLDIDDEKKQAEIDEKYLDRGVITINQVRNRLQMPPVEWGYLPFVPLNYAPYDTLVKYQQSKIASNIKSAMSDKVDNNLKVEDPNKPDPKDPKEQQPKAKKEAAQYGYTDDNDIMGRYMALMASRGDASIEEILWDTNVGKKILTGLEKVDPTLVKGVVGKLISERESLLSKTVVDFSQSRLISTANSEQLDWHNIMRNEQR
jgi:uncharacterized protein YxeA